MTILYGMLKGIVSGEDFNIRSVLSKWAPMVFKFFVVKKVKLRVFLACMKALTPVWKSLQKPSCSCFLIPAYGSIKCSWSCVCVQYVSENCSESRQRKINFRGFFLHPIRGNHRRKSTNSRKGGRNINFDAAFGTIFRNW